jgi:hypothetical protein
MKTINIKGKEYVTVNERLIHFRTNKNYQDWQIHEDVISVDSEGGIFKVTICDSNGVVRAQAHAQEDRDSSYINKTSFLENGFTSALGRALGYLGIGIDASIASADEVDMAVKKQELPDKLSLSVGDDNWDKVTSYIKTNKSQGSTKLLKALRTKYVISRQVEKELNSIIA